MDDAANDSTAHGARRDAAEPGKGYLWSPRDLSTPVRLAAQRCGGPGANSTHLQPARAGYDQPRRRPQHGQCNPVLATGCRPGRDRLGLYRHERRPQALHSHRSQARSLRQHREARASLPRPPDGAKRRAQQHPRRHPHHRRLDMRVTETDQGIEFNVAKCAIDDGHGRAQASCRTGPLNRRPTFERSHPGGSPQNPSQRSLRPTRSLLARRRIRAAVSNLRP